MKMTAKKTLALLTACALLTGSAAAYAAQLPNDAAPAAAISSSGVQASLSLSIPHYTLTEDRFTAMVAASISGDYQSRLTTYHITIEQELGAGSSNFAPVYDGQSYGSPSGLEIDQPVSLKPGERLHVRVRASAELFYGYNYIGSAGATEDFYFTL